MAAVTGGCLNLTAAVTAQENMAHLRETRGSGDSTIPLISNHLALI